MKSLKNTATINKGDILSGMDDNALTEYYSPILIIWLSIETTRNPFIAQGRAASSLQEEPPCIKISVVILNVIISWAPPATRYT